jgi:hypothetical protein
MAVSLVIFGRVGSDFAPGTGPTNSDGLRPAWVNTPCYTPCQDKPLPMHIVFKTTDDDRAIRILQAAAADAGEFLNFDNSVLAIGLRPDRYPAKMLGILGKMFISRSRARLLALGVGVLSIWGASHAGGAQLTLSWVDTSNVEAGYKIERALACGTFTQVAIVGANVTRYVDSGLADSTLYCYRLRAYNAAGHSPYSAVVSATTRAVTPSLAISSQPERCSCTCGG